jgi:cytoskeleton protein RodZ
LRQIAAMDQASGGVGAALARARESRGISLSDLSARTKLSVPVLRALERNDFDRLPGGIFIRGYLRSYAREVGCDPEHIVAQYDVLMEARRPRPATDVRASRGVTLPAKRAQLLRGVPVAWVGGAAVVIIGAILQLSVAHGRHFTPEPTAEPPAVDGAPPSNSPSPSIPPVSNAVPPSSANAPANAPVVAPSNTPVAAPSSAPPAAPLAGTGGTVPGASRSNTDAAPVAPVQLDIHPKGPCWVGATADGEVMVYRLLNADEHEQVRANQEVVLRIGDAAACTFTVNGRPVRRLGAAEQAVTLTITPENYRELLEPAPAGEAPPHPDQQ